MLRKRITLAFCRGILLIGGKEGEVLAFLPVMITKYSTALWKSLLEGLFNLPVGVQKCTRRYITISS
jgi:hypothetical protein